MVDGTLHMFYTVYSGGLSSIVRDTSADGISFTGSTTTVVSAQSGYYNGSPDLYYHDGQYYLFWVRINNSTSFHEILARSASTITGLDRLPR